MMIKKTFSSSASGAIGFIGLGQMGLPMALNLSKKFNLLAYDVMALDTLRLPPSITKASSLHQIANDCSVVLTMLPSNDTVSQVISSLSKSMKKGSLIIDCSTVDPQLIRSLQKTISCNGIDLVDAPVSGGTNGAANGTLTFMVGAEGSLFQTVEPILSNMGQKLFSCGSVGTGQVAKISNNLMLAISMAGLSEAISLGSKLGMDAKKLNEVINASSGRCWSSEIYSPVPGFLPNVPSSKNYDGGFASKLMLKDVTLAMEASKNADVDLKIGKTTFELYEKLVKEGKGSKDFSVIFQEISK